MTEYLNKITNPAAPWSFIDDTEENILHDLERYPLDPVFELYGNFINPSPEWLSEEVAAKYAGCEAVMEIVEFMKDDSKRRGYIHPAGKLSVVD